MKNWVLHETDLFRPHEDPDDHWDLACQFALAKKGLIDLRGILIDYPPRPTMEDPDVLAVAQLGWISGVAVPMGMGQICAADAPGSGLNMLNKILTEAPEPIVLHIVGSCRDIAECGMRWPELFAQKVKAIYLNAGSGTNTTNKEYNVELDVEHYAQIFKLPCPIYWMPCFHNVDNWNESGYGTYYRFLQKRLFGEMSVPVLNYFLNMLSRNRCSDWFAMLDRPVDERQVQYFGEQYRNMWCTGGFLHTAGLAVWEDGTIAPCGTDPDREVFEFVPIQVTCDMDGRTHWNPDPQSKDRFIYHVKNKACYQEAMTIALGKMISWLSE